MHLQSFPLPVFRLPIAYLYRGRLERRTFIAGRSFFAYRGIYLQTDNG
jgi:hypothetical protein